MPKPSISIIKKINDQDANTEQEAVRIADLDSTMKVTFEVENTGEVPLENVTITDIINQGGKTNDINNLLEDATATITDNDDSALGTSNGTEKNGTFTLIPGGKATIVLKEVNVPAPKVLHKDTATVTGKYGEVVVKDDDPAHAKGAKEIQDIKLTKYINDQDANTVEEAARVNVDSDTMDVKFVIENTGNVRLYNVALYDDIVIDGYREYDESSEYNDWYYKHYDELTVIDKLINDQEFVVRDSNGEVKRSFNNYNWRPDLYLDPGETITISVTAPAPQIGENHKDIGYVSAYTGSSPRRTGEEVTDKDPAHAIKEPQPEPFFLPGTGMNPYQRYGLLSGSIMMLLLAGIYITRRREN